VPVAAMETPVTDAREMPLCQVLGLLPGRARGDALPRARPSEQLNERKEHRIHSILNNRRRAVSLGILPDQRREV
jgi:hypothetical protein